MSAPDSGLRTPLTRALAHPALALDEKRVVLPRLDLKHHQPMARQQQPIDLVHHARARLGRERRPQVRVGVTRLLEALRDESKGRLLAFMGGAAEGSPVGGHSGRRRRSNGSRKRATSPRLAERKDAPARVVPSSVVAGQQAG